MSRTWPLFLVRLGPARSQIGYLALPHTQYTDFPDRKNRNWATQIKCACKIRAHNQRIILIKRLPSSLNHWKHTCTVRMNLHGVCRSARPTFKWTPKAHHMMGKTQKGHCERSFGTKVLVSANNATTFSRRPNLLKRTSTKMSLQNEFRIRKLCSRNQPCHERDHCS